MSTFPTLVRDASPNGEDRYFLGDPLVDRYLEFVAGRVRANTLRAVTFDLKTFFTIVTKSPTDVVAADIFDFLADQRGDRRVVRLVDGESGLAARTIARRLSSVSGFYSYVIARDDTPLRSNPVPRGLSTRRRGGEAPSSHWCVFPARCPRSSHPAKSTRWLVHFAPIATEPWCLRWYWADSVGVRCLGCSWPTSRWLNVRCSSLRAKAATNGSCRFRMLSSLRLANTCVLERPSNISTDRVFVALKGPSRDAVSTAEGVDVIMRGARQRAGLERATCHQLRHTCLTRLREAGMALEAVQAQAGHVSIESTRVYLHLTNDWLADEYRCAADLIDAGHAEELLALKAINA